MLNCRSFLPTTTTSTTTTTVTKRKSLKFILTFIVEGNRYYSYDSLESSMNFKELKFSIELQFFIAVLSDPVTIHHIWRQKAFLEVKKSI
jgi:hypothetical protein